MTDYASISNEELRRVIAERLGYAVVYHTSAVAWHLFDPAGVRIEHPKSLVEEDAWGYTPNWPEDLNAAFSLISNFFNLHLEIITREDQNGVQRMWRCVYGMTNDSREGYSLFEYPARAVCLAWLAWSDAHAAPGDGTMEA